MFIHFHAASLPSWFLMFGKSSGHCCKTHHFLWSTLSAIWFNPLQVSKRASPVHHEQLPVLSNHLPQKRWRAFSIHSWLTKALEHQKCTVPTASWILPSTWDQLKICDPIRQDFNFMHHLLISASKINPVSSPPYFFNVHHFLGTNHVRFIHITVSCNDLPEHGRKTPKHKFFRIYNKFRYRLILTLLNLYYSSVVKSS